ncbi:Hypothetical protein I595_2796 [Croceitalea dokdonensis DOKDO 023]|uniref:Uncharacterized protein n=1 Tax=Croceitalea dokdonensis DOKDO 023 TaxID=1300341 RepID=A0A0P7APD4_9FLAO|nr:Hypothetical protein I595_2796 [Croceitalea dokdonensis DOKDO 023]
MIFVGPGDDVGKSLLGGNTIISGDGTLYFLGRIKSGWSSTPIENQEHHTRTIFGWTPLPSFGNTDE